MPWVLPENIPDADFFVGLSYMQFRDGQRLQQIRKVGSTPGHHIAFDSTRRSEHLASLSR